MKKLNLPAALFTLTFFLATGCSMQVHDDKGDHKKNVTINTPLGGLKVRTDDVDAKDTGIPVYPGAVMKESENKDHDQKKANVNIDTPWFGLKVVALTYQSTDSPEKIWDFYKKDLSRYGKVLECKPGSPDLKITKQGKDDLTCSDDKDHNIHITEDSSKHTQLRVGTASKQRIVAMKPNSGGTEFSLVLVNVREGKETL